MRDDRRPECDAIVLEGVDDEEPLDSAGYPDADPDRAVDILLRIIDHVRADIGLPTGQIVVWRNGAAVGDLSIEMADETVQVAMSVTMSRQAPVADDRSVPSVEAFPRRPCAERPMVTRRRAHRGSSTRRRS